ncbi:hypothetical protein [Rubinisphaera italica]|uniref:Bacterial type II secretion system protein G n=1 Tax=Rubinisphaera italica TaxID=2527969 RepID=A0A5C5XH94_9PLAN|nr:hypothetical protein [Rubinisphaera italica]TWT61801.1 hypothetical protein Pan54_25380 [Rubinisphaera italica]
MSEEIKSKRKSGWHRLLHPKFAVPVVLLLVLIAAPYLYRSYRLSLISDPGEPFDVEAFIVEHTVPDSDNALSLFHEAIGSLKGTIPKDELSDIYDIFWEETPPDERMQTALDYVKYNEQALLIWEKASCMPNFFEVQPDQISYTSPLEILKPTRQLSQMIAIQAWIASQNGDDTEATKWLLCNLRTSRLITLNSCMFNRTYGIAIHNMTTEMIVKWLAHQQLTLTELKQLLNEIQKIYQMTPPISDFIKMEYLMLLHSENILLQEVIPKSKQISSNSVLAWTLFFQGEPELFYRINKQCVTNNLLYVDIPKYQRPALSSHGRNLCYLYETPIGETLPPEQNSPNQIEEASETSDLFKVTYYDLGKVINVIDLENIRQRITETAIMLEIYRKIKGEFPETLNLAFSTTKELPVDEINPSGDTLKYEKDSPQHYRLWSVGVDEIDSGGEELSLNPDALDFGIEMIRKP